ncbi:MAG: hypothetical protein IT350_18730 [Deltaproteobacteria bacterium]|nr:hypothetical protein [Deltaproteobacteria bacterium]
MLWTLLCGFVAFSFVVGACGDGRDDSGRVGGTTTDDDDDTVDDDTGDDDTSGVTQCYVDAVVEQGDCATRPASRRSVRASARARGADPTPVMR